MTPDRAPAAPAPDALREWASGLPVVRALKDALPTFPRGLVAASPGLYVDASHAPAIELAGNLRVSVLRVLSVTPEGEKLVGQVQVTEDVRLGSSTRRARTYVHDADVYATREVDDTDSWWVSVLDLHYERGGPLVPVPAAA